MTGPRDVVVDRGDIGVRLRDVATDLPLTGPDVALWPLQDPSAVRALRPSRASGIYGASTFPGLLDYEQGRRPASAFIPDPPVSNAAMRVTDPGGNFLPLVQKLTVPWLTVVDVVLFSSPARPAPGALGTVRCQLEAPGGGPAAWAVVTVTLPGVPAVTGVADARGMASVLVPYAAALPDLAGSPPHGAATGAPTWPATVRVRYDPAAQVTVPGSGTADPPESASLLAQRAASVQDGAAPAASLVRTLQLGSDLVVTTPGHSTLLVVPP